MVERCINVTTTLGWGAATSPKALGDVGYVGLSEDGSSAGKSTLSVPLSCSS